MLPAADVSIVILPLKTLSFCLLPGGSVLFISTITIKCSFQAWKCPRIFLPFIKYQEFRISFACLLLESKNVKFLILEALSCYVEVKILISVDRARGDQQQQQRAASSARWREGDNTEGGEGFRYRDRGVYRTYSELQNISPFGYNMFVVFFNRYIIMYSFAGWPWSPPH